MVLIPSSEVIPTNVVASLGVGSALEEGASLANETEEVLSSIPTDTDTRSSDAAEDGDTELRDELDATTTGDSAVVSDTSSEYTTVEGEGDRESGESLV